MNYSEMVAPVEHVLGHHCLSQDNEIGMFFLLLVYIETFAPALHLSSLLEAGQDYNII